MAKKITSYLSTTAPGGAPAPIASYKFDNDTNKTLDQTGNGKTLTAAGTWVYEIDDLTGLLGAYIDGTGGEYLTIADEDFRLAKTTTGAGTGAYTIEFIIKSYSEKEFCTCAGGGGASETPATNYLYRISDGQAVYGFLSEYGNGDNTDFDFTGAYKHYGEVFYFCITCDATGEERKVYINGVLKSTSVGQHRAEKGDAANTQILSIGVNGSVKWGGVLYSARFTEGTYDATQVDEVWQEISEDYTIPAATSTKIPLGIFYHGDDGWKLYKMTNNVDFKSWERFPDAPHVGNVSTGGPWGLWANPAGPEIVMTVTGLGSPARYKTQHFDGTSWTEKITTNTGGSQNYFRAIVGNSASDLWAIDYDCYIFHYDGTSWTEDTAFTTLLEAVGAQTYDRNKGSLWMSPTGVLWVGTARDSPSTLRMYKRTAAGVWTDEWTNLNEDIGIDLGVTTNGTSIYPVRMDGISDSDIWAGGKDLWIYRFNGTAWSRAQIVSTSADPYDIIALGVDDIRVSTAGYDPRRMYFWNGSSWTYTTYRALSEMSNDLDQEYFLAVDTTNIFAVGQNNVSSGIFMTSMVGDPTNNEWVIHGKADTAFESTDLDSGKARAAALYDPAVKSLPLTVCSLPKIDGDMTITNYECLKSQHKDIDNGGGVTTVPFSLGTRFLHIRKPK